MFTYKEALAEQNRLINFREKHYYNTSKKKPETQEVKTNTYSHAVSIKK